jgi:molybdopterin-guanine dinucleotide biosynthesis protein MobB
MLKTIFVFGTKNSGKTTIAEYLVKGLSDRGFTVGNIKHIHHEFTIDTEGKDTYRMRKAGSKMVASFSPSEIALLRAPGDVEVEFVKLSKQLAEDRFDYLVVEGFKVISLGFPAALRILTCKTEAELDSLIPSMLPEVDCISGVVATSLGSNAYKGLPVLRFPQEGEELLRLAIAGTAGRPLPADNPGLLQKP